MDNHEFAERYFRKYFENQFQVGNFTKNKEEKLQRHKFQVLSNLISDLFEQKNSRDKFKTITNLIITSLTSFEDKYPVYTYSSSVKEVDKKHKDILKKEFNNGFKEHKKLLSIGKQFLNVLSRFTNQYEMVSNIIITQNFSYRNRTIPN